MIWNGQLYSKLAVVYIYTEIIGRDESSQERELFIYISPENEE